MRQYLNASDEREMISMFRLNETKSFIARRFQVTPRTVDDVLLRNGEYNRVTDTPLARKIIRHARSGSTNNEIADFLCCATSYVMRVCLSHGFRPRQYSETQKEFMARLPK